MAHLFISYSQRDTESVRLILRELSRMSDSVWSSLGRSPYVTEELEMALRQCSSLLVIVTPDHEVIDQEFDERLGQWLSILLSRGIPCIQSDVFPSRAIPPDNTTRDYLSLLRMMQTDPEFDQLSLSPPFDSSPPSIPAEELFAESLDELLCPPPDECPGLGKQSLERYRQILLEKPDLNTEQQVRFIGHRIRHYRHTLGLSRAELAGQLEVEVEILVTIENGCGDVETAFWLLESVQQLQSDMLDDTGDGLVTGLH